MQGIIFFIFASFIGAFSFFFILFCLVAATEILFDGITLSDVFAALRVQKGDTYRNYLKCKGRCGTCKHHQGYLKGSKVLCKLNEEEVDERSTCDYYKMHRCFKKYERRV